MDAVTGPGALSHADDHVPPQPQRHLPDLTLLTPEGRPVPLTEIVADLDQERVAISVLAGRLHFRPAPSLVIKLVLPPWKEFLLHAHAGYRSGDLRPFACTSCGEITITRPRRRTKDRKKYTSGPDCRMTPGCPGRHDVLIDIPWAPSVTTEATGNVA